MAEIDLERLNQVELQFGGLKFEVYYTRYFGPTTRVFGKQSDEWVEMLRFDDFVDVPHYHAPAESDVAIMLDVSTQGEPIEFYMDVLSNKMEETLAPLGFGDVVPTIDDQVVKQNLPTLRARDELRPARRVQPHQGRVPARLRPRPQGHPGRDVCQGPGGNGCRPRRGCLTPQTPRASVAIATRTRPDISIMLSGLHRMAGPDARVVRHGSVPCRSAGVRRVPRRRPRRSRRRPRHLSVR